MLRRLISCYYYFFILSVYRIPRDLGKIDTKEKIAGVTIRAYSEYSSRTKESCSRTLLYRCTSAEMHWNKNAVSHLLLLWKNWLRHDVTSMSEELSWDGIWMLAMTVTTCMVTTLQTMWNSLTIPWHYPDSLWHSSPRSVLFTSLLSVVGVEMQQCMIWNQNEYAQVKQSQEWMQICS